jgi:hypothetical protein
MRKLSLFLLLASSAFPALAAPDNARGDRRNGDSKSEQSETRSQRAESRAERAQQRQENRSERASVRQQSQGSDQAEPRRYGAQRSERAQPSDQGTTASIRERIEQRRGAASAPAGDAVRRMRTRDRDGVGEGQSTWRQRERQVRTIPDVRPRVTQPSAAERRIFADRHRRDYRDGKYKRWTNNWRHDRRYDWNDYRKRNRSIFRLGFYYDPFGWNYRRWSTGSYLYPSYYGSNFWLNDPWQYRLPPAYGPYRWVRYWDDALLVNIYTGQVVDVINNFFW